HHKAFFRKGRQSIPRHIVLASSLDCVDQECRMDWKPTVMMMAVVIMYAVLNVLTKMAFNEGMHTTVFIVLRLLVAALFLSPIAYFKER
uniref:WAT1-related protein n=1 Tax=Aegilops tauschii subsp. strangulata TaxID=200361 RepID=A0A453JHS0_AEGTS